MKFKQLLPFKKGSYYTYLCYDDLLYLFVNLVRKSSFVIKLSKRYSLNFKKTFPSMH